MWKKLVLGSLLVLLAYGAVEGKSAVEDLQALRDEVCACAPGEACEDAARRSIIEFAERHAGARVSRRQEPVVEKTMEDLTICNPALGLSLLQKLSGEPAA